MMVTTTVMGGPPETVKERTRVTLTIDTSARDRVLTEEEHAREMESAAELARVRIEPGADPRAEWQNRTAQPNLSLWQLPVFEIGRRESPRCYFLTLFDAPDEYGRRHGRRYVPEDVARWRDSEHRAELTRRAKEHAAIRPGVYR